MDVAFFLQSEELCCSTQADGNPISPLQRRRGDIVDHAAPLIPSVQGRVEALALTKLRYGAHSIQTAVAEYNLAESYLRHKMGPQAYSMTLSPLHD